MRETFAKSARSIRLGRIWVKALVAGVAEEAVVPATASPDCHGERQPASWATMLHRHLAPLALLAAACAPAPDFMRSEVATDTATSAPPDVTPTEADVPDISDPCAACEPGERCVDGACQSCADSCDDILGLGRCGLDECGGACGCATTGECRDGTCLCATGGCVTTVTSFGARNAALAFDRRDWPVVLVGSGDDISVRREISVIRWDGASFDQESVDVSKPAVGTASVVVTANGHIHAIMSGTELTPQVPRHIVYDGTAWSAANFGSARCLAPALAMRAGAVLLGCFDPATGAAQFNTWNALERKWEFLTATSAIPGSADSETWSSEWAWTVDRKTDEIVVAFVRRPADVPTLAIGRMVYRPLLFWEDKDLGDLVSPDSSFLHHLAVVRDDLSVTRVIVRDEETPDNATVVLREFEETENGATTAVAWRAVGVEKGTIFAAAPHGGGGVDVFVVEQSAVSHRAWAFSASPSEWYQGEKLELGLDVIDRLSIGLDGAGRPSVLIQTDETAVRLWSPLYTR